MSRFSLPAAALLLAGSLPAHGGGVAAVLSSDLAAYQEAFEAFQAELGEKVPVLPVGERVKLPPGVKVVAAFGSQAALKRYPAGVVVITCLSPALRPGEDAPGPSVRMVPGAATLLAGLKSAQPSLKTLAVLWSDVAFDGYARALEREAAAAGLTVRRVPIEEPEQLPEALRRLRGSADALWLAPDPSLISERSMAALRDFSRSTRLPLFVPTVELVKGGAAAAIAVSFSEAGRTAARAAKRALAGETLPGEIFPDKVTAVFDPALAAQMGLRVSSEPVAVGEGLKSAVKR